MGHRLLIGMLTGVVLLQAAPSARAVERKAVDQAVERGVQALCRLQRFDGTWPHPKMGATALAGLTLLECGLKADDPAVKKAAGAVRATSINLNDTYSLALSILFLDRLDDPEDVPLIESMAVRLLAGQNQMGGWEYHCPAVSDAEVRRLTTRLKKRAELVARKPPQQPVKGKRTVEHLSPEIRQQLREIERIAQNAPRGHHFDPFAGVGDNSNTQFATIALWVARRHGLPVNGALMKVGVRFRDTQNADGGWGYTPGRGGLAHSTATMTCAGVLGLAVAQGASGQGDPRKNKPLENGLLALGGTIGDPVGPRGVVQEIGGRAYYFLWSLERVAVALDLARIGKKDWYGWGAEVLLANQQQDGTWQGAYGEFGADTCFALLFLRRANLTSDLTVQFRGRLEDPGERLLHGGGIGGKSLASRGPKIKSGLDARGTVVRDDPPPRPNAVRRTPEPDKKEPAKPPVQVVKPGPEPVKKEPDKKEPAKPQNPPARTLPAEDTDSVRLASSLVRAPANEQDFLLDRLRDRKGAKYTEALALAIPQLKGEPKSRARAALTARLARMTAKTLKQYLEDEDAEIRRAAALACATQEAKEHIPALINLLSDTDSDVERAAHAALKALSGQDFGPAANASRADRARAIVAWQLWWSKNDK